MYKFVIEFQRIYGPNPEDRSEVITLGVYKDLDFAEIKLDELSSKYRGDTYAVLELIHYLDISGQDEHQFVEDIRGYYGCEAALFLDLDINDMGDDKFFG